MGRLDGRVALVTGATRGIGHATAKLFAAEGARVVVISRNTDDVHRVASNIVSEGGEALGIACDVSDAAQIEATVRRVVDTYGRIDILVNNAFDPSVVSSSVLNISTDILQRNLEMGPIAYLRLMQACHPFLKASGHGRVINFASVAGVMGVTDYGAYAMAKEAVRALTRVSAREWGVDSITVNNVLPLADTWGAAEAGIPPPASALARFGSPEKDVAPVVLFLASDDSKFLTGYSFMPDGGAMIDAAR